jgi:threonine/homoserine/homoserine lactone efflux protein
LTSDGKDDTIYKICVFAKVFMAQIFFSALAVGFSGAMMPGPLLTYTIKQSLSSGPKAGVMITLGHALLEIALIILIFLGLDLVLKSDAAQITVGIAGGLVLAYMGLNMIVQSVKNNVAVNVDEKPEASRGMMLSSAVICATNPGFLLWWAVVGLGFLMQASITLGYIGVIIYFIGHFCADFIWYGFVSLVVGKTRRFIKQTPYRVIIAILGALLVFFAANFVWAAADKLL